MSKKDAVLLVSRALAFYLICWALDNVTYLPERLFAPSHHLSQSTVLPNQDYWSRYYFLTLGVNLLRVITLFVAAAWFWRCGPKVESFFSSQREVQE
jgi:hypothetical protein